MTAREDRWLLPRRQTEYPTRELISEATLHGRREAAFLALATISMIAIACFVLLGTRVIDLSALIATVAPDLDLGVALAMPLGVVPFVVGLVAVILACELYGRRRAVALVIAGALASAALVGIARIADVLDGHDVLFVPAVAMAACAVVAQIVTLLVFDALRRRTRDQLWLRAIAAVAVAQAAAWAAYGGVTYALALVELSAIVGIALGSAAVAVACTIVLTVPLAIVTHVLALYLRVARHTPVEDIDLDISEPRRQLPPALIVEEHEPRPSARRRAARASIQPYSSAEMRFFTEGDQLDS